MGIADRLRLGQVRYRIPSIVLVEIAHAACYYGDAVMIMDLDGYIHGGGFGRLSKEFGPDGFGFIVEGFNRIPTLLQVTQNLVEGNALDGNGVDVLVDFLGLEPGKPRSSSPQ